MRSCLAGDHLLHRAPYDLQIEFQSGAFNVAKVAFEAEIHVVRIKVAAAIAGDLGPAGETGTGIVVSHGKTGNNPLPIVTLTDRQRTGTYKTHIPS